MVCSASSSKFDPFMYLSLPLLPTGSSDTLTLEACIREFMKVEELSSDNMWRCPKCQDFRNATKQFTLWKLPPYLIMHIKRFQSDARRGHSKRADVVAAPLHDLDLSPFVSSESLATYNLYAVCNHHGTMSSGHYTAVCRSTGFDGGPRTNWFLFDDASITPISPDQVIDKNNYLLLFERTNDDGSPRRQSLSRPEHWPFRLSMIPKSFLRAMSSVDDDAWDHESVRSQTGGTKGSRLKMVFSGPSKTKFEQDTQNAVSINI